MHAVVARVSIGDFDAAGPELRDRIVPRVKEAPGFVVGHWTRGEDGTDGLSVLIFESEEQARAAAEMIRNGPPPATVTLESVEVREVVASA